MSKRFLEELSDFGEMSQKKQKVLESEKQWVSCGQSLITTNEESEQYLRKEVEVIKQRFNEFKSEIQTLRAQNEFLKSQANSQTLLFLQQYFYRRDLMSNKTICLTNFKPKKWSFSERICDDLSEVILQFLPIEDKFRFECVSKQFQRTVYQKQYELDVSEHKMIKNLKVFKLIVKKLPNIKSIKCQVIDSIQISRSVIDLIIKNCNQLTQFVGSLYLLPEKYKQFFAKKFGPQLTSLIISDSSYDSIISSFVKIREIDLIHNHYMSDEFYTKIKVKNLNKVSIRLTSCLNKRFIDNNKRITHLSIYLSDGNPIDSELRVISQLNQLISLKLFVKNFELKSLTDGLKQLTINCRKIKALSIRFEKIPIYFKINDIMCEIKRFKELKRLGITIWGTNTDNYFESKENLINSLKTDFKNLTHLTIGIYFSVLNEAFIQNIVNYLPNLQNLIIWNPIEITERTAHIVSQLSNLVTLELKIPNNSLINSFKNIIIKNCRKIKSIEIY